MIIFRAGLTGCIAACVNPDSTILDSDDEPFIHKAVLRFRSDEISKATGIPFKKIKVTKSIYDLNYHEFCSWTPYMANQYSKKVVGGYYDRSIDNLDTVTRWLAPDNFHEQLISIIGKRILWNESYTPFVKGPKISTLSLPKLMNILGLEERDDIGITNNSIYVTTINISTNCDVHQTVYLPSSDTYVYRVTLEGQKMIIESTEKVDLNSEVDFLPYTLFGINHNEWSYSDHNYEQKIGKIAPIDDEMRKRLIYEITQEHNIYSLGRTATWRNILLDDCLKDIHQINSMIQKTRYQRMLGK